MYLKTSFDLAAFHALAAVTIDGCKTQIVVQTV
jgi:hypothetical protein